MKKKKDPSFDELKKEVIKPLRETVITFGEHFNAVSAYFKD